MGSFGEPEAKTLAASAVISTPSAAVATVNKKHVRCLLVPEPEPVPLPERRSRAAF